MKSRSLTRSLTLWYALSMAFTLALALSILYHSLKVSLDAENRRILEDRAQAISSLLDRKEDPIDSLKRRVESEWALRRFEKIYVRVTDRGGKTIAETPGLPAQAFDENFFVQQSRYGDWNITLALDLHTEKKILSDYEKRMILILLIAFAAVLVMGRLIARRGLRPVRAMASTLEQIHSEDLERRIMTDVPEELEVLKRTFNELLERIKSSVDKISRFSGDIAHEIRTPINNLGGELEVALSRARSVEEYQEILGSCLEECRRLSSLADSLLFLTRTESPHAQMQRKKLDLASEIRDLVEFHEASAADKGITLLSNVPNGLAVFADHALLQAAIGNLLSNALRYTPPGGTIAVTARSEARQGADDVIIRVSDTGSGIPKEHLPFVFDRLYRADAQRSHPGHFGLGLSIVHAILRIHQGSVSISSEPELGTSVSLSFPKHDEMTKM